MKITQVDKNSFKIKSGSYRGIVRRRAIVSYTDFEKDEIHEVTRWFSYKLDYLVLKRDCYKSEVRVGRETGYETKEEAIEALRIEFAMMTRDRCC